MDWDDAIPWFFLLYLAPFVLAARSLVVSRRLRQQVATLADKVAMLDHRLFRLDERIAGTSPEAPATEAAAPAPAAAPAAQPVEATPAAPPTPTDEPERPPLAAAAPAASPREAARAFEERLVENWLVWVGGLALALGGAFLVKLSIDYGLLTPPVRIVLAVLLGLGLCAGSEWVTRREAGESENGAAAPSYVPQALAAGGAATVFAAVYAAYQLYGLIGATTAFVLLAVTAGATVALSLRQGVLVAALGLAGAYLVPALVVSDAPRALPLFLYLAFVTAGVLAVLRHRGWWWLAAPTLLGAFGWTMVWLGFAPAHPQSAVVGGYILVQLGLFAGLRRGVPRVGFLTGIAESPQVAPLLRFAFGLFAFAAFVLVHVAAFDNASLATSYAAAAFLLGFAYRDGELDDVMIPAALLLLAVLASWNLPFFSDQQVFLAQLRLPLPVSDFATACLAAVLLLGGGGFAAHLAATRPGRWGALSVIAPVMILVIAYWRLHEYGFDIGWTGLSLALAGLFLAAAATAAKRRDGTLEREIALAAYAVGMLGGTILGASFALGTAWLTVAIALHLPALGWVEGRLDLKVLRHAALVVAGIVLVRLAFNPYLLGYPIGPTPIFNWLLYGYGMPALAFIVATRQFGSRADDLLVGVLEAGSALFTTLLLTFELRHALYGRIDAPLSDFGSDALSPLLWLGLAAFALWLGERRRRPVLLWGGVILFWIATVQVVVWATLVDSPLFSRLAVGRTMIVDLLSLAYLLPALLYTALVLLRLGPVWLRLTSRVLAAGLAFVWLTLEVRHAFHGEFITVNLLGPSTGDAEWYSYSAAWLAFAGVGLAAGLIRRDEWLRRVSLGGIGLVVAKVFLSDMAQLEGALRALSFIGLGGALVAIGYAYRRLRPLQESERGA
ncbi:MAG: DUF2339 domain-containing protein [Alphaproteobacteria bacterium]|nr:DUF2339 domain-containing protein [Alphaproteobacteria bacterium]